MWLSTVASLLTRLALPLLTAHARPRSTSINNVLEAVGFPLNPYELIGESYTTASHRNIQSMYHPTLVPGICRPVNLPVDVSVTITAIVRHSPLHRPMI